MTAAAAMTRLTYMLGGDCMRGLPLYTGEQMTLLEDINAERPEVERREKRNFMARFQRWSDRMKDDPVTSFGKCGYGTICDNCDGEMKRKPCARAYADYVKEHGLKPNYPLSRKRCMKLSSRHSFVH